MASGIAAMDPRHRELNAEDAQMPSLSVVPHDVLKRILQYVYGSGKESAALQCRLVCRSFNDLMMKNMRIHLNYKFIQEPIGYQLSLTTKDWSRNRLYIPTDQLLNSSLIERIFTMEVINLIHNPDFVDEDDLVNLASRLSRPVDVCLSSGASLLLLLPLTEVPLIRVVAVEKLFGRGDLTPPELDFLANLPHLSKLALPMRDLLQLVERVDLHNISELRIMGQPCRLQDLVNFNDNFINLHTLQISISFNDADSFRFRGVRLPNLVKFDLSASSDRLTYADDRIERLLTSMGVAMPKLRDLRYLVKRQGIPDLHEMTQLIPVVFQSCPATVEDFSFNIDAQAVYADINIFQQIVGRITQSQREQILTTLFTSVLNSRITRVSFDSYVNPAGYNLEANRSGVQVGLPVKTKKFDTHVDKYQLKRRPGDQICTLQISYDWNC